MPDLLETDMGKVCDTCGDIGAVGALVTCTKCKIGCEHLYCMGKVCTDYTVVPVDWCCEMCRSTSLVSSDCGIKKVSSEAVTCNLSTKVPHCPKEFTDQKMFCKGARGNWHEKAVGKGKTRYLWTNEVKNMPSGETKGEPKRVGLVSSKPSKSVASDHNMAQMKPKKIIPAESSYMEKRNPKFGPSKNSEQLRPTRSGNTHNNTSVQKVKELKAILTPVKEQCQMRQNSSVRDIGISYAKKQKEMGETSSAYQMSRRNQTCDIPQTDATPSPANALTSTEVIERTSGNLQKPISKESCADLPSYYCQSPMSGVKHTKVAEPKNSDAGNAVYTVKDFFIKAAAVETLPTDPATVASWMGSFILKDEKTSISFRAHPTSQGLPKVKEFSKKLPEVLEFELCSYEHFLRTVFKGYDPDEEDIGLYFFPDDMNRLNAYISYLEQLSGQFFLRSCIDGVELLVFTSKVLHKDYRKRNKYDFLWGIYRRRRHGKLKGAEEETMVVDMDIDTEDFDMEVDMVGGEIVGRVDVVVPKQSTERSYGLSGAEANTVILPASNSFSTSVPGNLDIPPGFSLSMRGCWNKIPPGFRDSASQKQNDVPPGFTVGMKIKEEVL